MAIPYPTQAELGDALRWLVAAGIPLDGASDHGTTVIDEVLVLSDPDDNGVELYGDRPMEDWPRTPDGGLAMFSKALNVQALLAAAVQALTSPPTAAPDRSGRSRHPRL